VDETIKWDGSTWPGSVLVELLKERVLIGWMCEKLRKEGCVFIFLFLILIES